MQINPLHNCDMEQTELLKDLLEEYLAGNIPSMPCGDQDLYKPVGETLLAAAREYFPD